MKAAPITIALKSMREENAINSPIEIKLYVFVIGVVLRFANLSLESIYKITTQQQQRIETLHSEFKTIHKIIHRFTWFVFQKKKKRKIHLFTTLYITLFIFQWLARRLTAWLPPRARLLQFNPFVSVGTE